MTSITINTKAAAVKTVSALSDTVDEDVFFIRYVLRVNNYDTDSSQDLKSDEIVYEIL